MPWQTQDRTCAVLRTQIHCGNFDLTPDDRGGDWYPSANIGSQASYRLGKGDVRTLMRFLLAGMISLGITVIDLEGNSTVYVDDDLSRFAMYGAEQLSHSEQTGYVTHSGAHIWYAAYGSGPTVIMLHGGLGNSRNWGYQVPELVHHGYRVLIIDTRGHGRSTRDPQSFSYELLASDVVSVMNSLGVVRAAFIGWSDGACTSMVLAKEFPQSRWRLLLCLQYGPKRREALPEHACHSPLLCAS